MLEHPSNDSYDRLGRGQKFRLTEAPSVSSSCLPSEYAYIRSAHYVAGDPRMRLLMDLHK